MLRTACAPGEKALVPRSLIELVQRAVGEILRIEAVSAGVKQQYQQVPLGQLRGGLEFVAVAEPDAGVRQRLNLSFGITGGNVGVRGGDALRLLPHQLAGLCIHAKDRLAVRLVGIAQHIAVGHGAAGVGIDLPHWDGGVHGHRIGDVLEFGSVSAAVGSQSRLFSHHAIGRLEFQVFIPAAAEAHHGAVCGIDSDVHAVVVVEVSVFLPVVSELAVFASVQSHVGDAIRTVQL
ncbi:hypothetical protein SDC9_125587 [bioreactor metagenome]|uniref:Uncharacterized protein n=1 Tax=bioreactor metagenome TaxID=1076179 RepID=A0A645CNH0_9ZZZZ